MIMDNSNHVIVCAFCGKEVKKYISPGDKEKNRTGNFYCSRSCAAKKNNKDFPKRKEEGLCRGCNCQIPASSTFCKKCYLERFQVDWDKITYGEVKSQRIYQRNSRVRDLARALVKKENLERICENCGYNKHVEVCHKKGISTFTDDTLISTINSKENLVLLCPNCHWEFDKGLLNL